MSHPQDLPGGIPSRITGLTAGVIRHLLSLVALASEEGRLFVRQSVGALILLLALVLVAMIAYVAIISSVISLLAICLKWGWPVSLAAAGLVHLALVGLLYKALRSRVAPHPFASTTAELQRDIEVLSNYSESNR